MIWAATIGIFLPFTVGDTGKYVVILLLLPALVSFTLGANRRLGVSDLLVCSAGLWMILVKLKSELLFTALSESLAFVGSYVLGRSLVYGDAALSEFKKVLKLIAVAAILLAVMDPLTGAFFSSEIIRNVFHTPRPFRVEPIELRRHLFGIVVLRAESIFEHPILFGAFSTISGAIFIFIERSRLVKTFYFSLCAFGCVISISSSALLGLVVTIASVLYNRLFESFPGRWKALWGMAAIMSCASFALSDNPITWLLRHTTLDPADGYYRLLIWESAFEYISSSPTVGADPITWTGDEILGNSIDCVWLVLSLNYGLPVAFSILLGSLAACGLFRPNINVAVADRRFLQWRMTFSLVLTLFIFMGLTVHFWGCMWMFWGFCIGIRASIEEYGAWRWPAKR